MIYGYRCPVCRQEYTSSERCDRLFKPCHECSHPGPLHRDFSGISMTPPMPEHWNKTVDRPISSMHQFKEALKIRGEELSRYTQVEQRLEVLDPEQARQGVTAEGLDATNRVRRAKGLRTINLDAL